MRNVALRALLVALVFWLAGLGSSSFAQFPFFKPMKKADDLIRRQEGIKYFKDAEALLTSENTHVLISLSKQRAWLMAGDQIFIDSPVSTGKVAGMTPTGSFSVMEKDPNHRSNIFGNFVDNGGRTVRSGVSLKIDSAPSGTHYVGAPMKWFMRLTDGGVGMHVGILPGYPASHGCVRMPEETARLFYSKVRPGTPVQIVQ